MQTSFNEEQIILQASVKKFLEKHMPIEKVRKLIEEQEEFDLDLWEQTVRAGFHSIIIPEKYGGADGTLMDNGIVFEEAGKVLFPSVLYSNTYAILQILSVANEKEKQQYLSKIAEGQCIATVAFEEQNVHNDPFYFNTTAQKCESGWILSGEKYFVLNAYSANLILVCAKVNNSFGVFVVNSETEGVTLRKLSTIGQDFQYIMTLDNVQMSEDSLLGGIVPIEHILEPRYQMTALQSIEMVGGCLKVINETVEYVTMRKQFSVPIGSFQAVQHHLANLYTKTRGARLAAYKALSYLDFKDPQAKKAVHIAKAYTSETYALTTTMAHQLWGGMGYSTESNLYLWSNRSKATELSFGSTLYHRQHLGIALKSI